MALHHNVDMNARMRATQALKMRVAGATWGEIAKTCGYKHSGTAFNQAHSILKEHEAEAADEYRKVADMRLDVLLRAVWDKATGCIEVDPQTGANIIIEPDLEAMAMVLRIEARRAKLMGLDIKPDQEMIQAQVLIREIAAPLGDV